MSEERRKEKDLRISYGAGGRKKVGERWMEK